MLSGQFTNPIRRHGRRLISRLCFYLFLVAIMLATDSGIVAAPATAQSKAGDTANTAPTVNNTSEGDTAGWPAWRFFPIGVYENSHFVAGDTTRFEAMVHDLQSRGLDSVLLTNGWVERDAPLLDVSDRLDFNVIPSAMWNLDRKWWPADVPADLETARNVIWPLVDQYKRHPSLKGYYVVDEPGFDRLEKTVLATQAFQERDPDRPAMPVLLGADRVGPIFQAAQPDVILIDVYPFAYTDPICDFRMTGFGYPNLDFVSYIRTAAQNKPAETPLWVILQTHQFGIDGHFYLREPVPAEVRAQNWLAIGEGATGIFWFIYTSDPIFYWRGLVDNPALYQEVTTLARRVGPLRDVLMGLRKAPDRFTITGGNNPYVSTLASADGTQHYVVAVNMDCEQPRMLSIRSSTLHGQLLDLESYQTYALGSPIEFQPGDGRIFQLITPGDVDGDRAVTMSDVQAITARWHTGPVSYPFDQDGDADVDTADVMLVATRLGNRN